MDKNARSVALSSELREALGADDFFKLAVEASPTGVLVVASTGAIVLANDILARQFGYERHELIGESVETLLPDSLRGVHAAHRSGFGHDPQPRAMGLGREVVGRRKDGSEIPVEIGLNTIPTPAGPMVFASVIDISERRRQEGALRQTVRDRLAFERLVSDVSATFVNLHAGEVDQAISDAIRRIAEALDLDRGSLFQLAAGGTDFILTHSWARFDEPAPTYHLSAGTHFPWSLARLLKGQAACFSAVDEIPNDVERASSRRYATKSRAAIPLSIEGRVVGTIAFGVVREERRWPEETLIGLELIARVFASALARQQSDVALQASEQRFRTLSDEAPVMIWMSDPGGACTWFNRQWLEFVGQPMAHEIGGGWQTGVHPDDLSSCVEVHTAAVAARWPYKIEYRLRREDGEWRWVLGTGAAMVDADGAFRGHLGSCVDITEQKQTKLQLEGSLAEVQRLRDQLQRENVYLRRDVQERLGTTAIAGNSAAVRRALAQVEQVAATDSTVLLLGETGTGKELFATQIHERSARRTRAMVRVNCAAIPGALIESELFGREKGAFTGALARQIGRFELADQSTIFLDEIGDLPHEIQVKLLRVLEERQIERLGSPRSIRVDTRIIAATHQNLEERIGEGQFREDLFYRLNVFPIRIPPLRERAEDIPLLVWRFVEEFSRAFAKPIESISRENMAELQQHSWPGNIRELRNVVERAMIITTSPRLTISLPAHSAGHAAPTNRLDDVEREHIRIVLENSAWRIRGSGGAAERLGMKPTTLESRIAKLGLKRPHRL